MRWELILSGVLSVLFFLPSYSQELTTSDIQFAKGAVFIGSSVTMVRPHKQASTKQFNYSSFGFNNFTRVSLGYFPIQKLAIVPEIGLQTFNRPEADGVTQVRLPDNLLTFGANLRYYFSIDPICGAWGVQAGYNSGKYLSGAAPLAHQINTELVIAKPIPFKFAGKKLQLEGALGFISGDFAQKDNTLYFSSRFGLNYYLNTKKIIARELGVQ